MICGDSIKLRVIGGVFDWPVVFCLRHVVISALTRGSSAISATVPSANLSVYYSISRHQYYCPSARFFFRSKLPERVYLVAMPPPTKEELWKSGQDEIVEVNQRALIDSGCALQSQTGELLIRSPPRRSEILARYSGEHTSELAQIVCPSLAMPTIFQSSGNCYKMPTMPA